MDQKEEECLFCQLNSNLVIAEDEFCYARKDGFPVTELHTLIIPKRHIASYFDLHPPEVSAIYRMLAAVKGKIEKQDDLVSGFNVGINVGEDAGQSIFHVHIHMIPRRKGDVDSSRGGVRGVIPNKRNY